MHAKWTIAPGMIMIFGVSGSFLGTQWMLTKDGADGYMILQSPAPVSPDIVELLDSTNRTDIAYIAINASVAARLFLEGIISWDHMSDAHEEDGAVIVEDVLTGDITRTIIIVPDESVTFSIALLNNDRQELARSNRSY